MYICADPTRFDICHLIEWNSNISNKSHYFLGQCIIHMMDMPQISSWWMYNPAWDDQIVIHFVCSIGSKKKKKKIYQPLELIVGLWFRKHPSNAVVCFLSRRRLTIHTQNCHPSIHHRPYVLLSHRSDWHQHYYISSIYHRYEMSWSQATGLLTHLNWKKDRYGQQRSSLVISVRIINSDILFQH